MGKKTEKVKTAISKFLKEIYHGMGAYSKPGPQTSRKVRRQRGRTRQQRTRRKG